MIPRIFISYIKEDKEYREQIQKLIRTLKMQGLTVITTDDIKFGTRFSMYKEQIEECNFVLCICTPKYKEKADTNRHGSDVVISSDIYKVNESKFIPVLLKEDEENSFPIWAKNKKYIDYRNGSDKELIYFARAVNKYVEAYESRKSYEESESIIIEHPDGTCERKNVVCAFKAIDTGDEYVVYTEDEKNRKGEAIIFVSKIINTSELISIEDEEEWKRVKRFLWELGVK